VLLDLGQGRGTENARMVSQLHGLAEFLHEHPAKPKTLFATHYHELNEMSEVLLEFRIIMSQQKLKDTVLFVRKLKGGRLIVLEFMCSKDGECRKS
jgi:DNA mismatch repair protein MutS